VVAPSGAEDQAIIQEIDKGLDSFNNTITLRIFVGDVSVFLIL